MQLERKSSRTNNRRASGWEGKPLDLVEAIPPFMFKSDKPMIKGDRRNWLGATLSWAVSNTMDDFALYGTAMHPQTGHALVEDGYVPKDDKDSLHARQLNKLESSILPPAGALGPIPDRSSAKERVDRPARHGPVADRPVDLERYAPTKPVRDTSAGWGERVLSILAMPWRGLARAAEMHRMRTALEALDDRSLRDIGLSRHDIDVVVRYGRRFD